MQDEHAFKYYDLDPRGQVIGQWFYDIAERVRENAPEHPNTPIALMLLLAARTAVLETK